MASGSATRTWQAIANSMPPPSATPLIAASAGLPIDSILRNARCALFGSGSASSSVCTSSSSWRTSAPATNEAVPLPGEHHRLHVVAARDVVDHDVQLVERALVQRVHRRIGDRHERDARHRRAAAPAARGTGCGSSGSPRTAAARRRPSVATASRRSPRAARGSTPDCAASRCRRRRRPRPARAPCGACTCRCASRGTARPR